MTPMLSGSLMMAVDRGIAEAILIGRRKEIVRVLDEMGKDARRLPHH